MSLYDWFFPEQAQAGHLRRIAEQNRRQRMTRPRQTIDLSHRIKRLEEDAGFVCLVLGAVLKVLDCKGHVTNDDLRKAMSHLDDLDGIRDGKMDVELLKNQSTQSDVLRILDSDVGDSSQYEGIESPIPSQTADPSERVADDESDSVDTARANSMTTEQLDGAIQRLQQQIAELQERREQIDD